MGFNPQEIDIDIFEGVLDSFWSEVVIQCDDTLAARRQLKQLFKNRLRSAGIREASISLATNSSGSSEKKKKGFKGWVQVFPNNGSRRE